jgi:hypothetical protein
MIKLIGNEDKVVDNKEYEKNINVCTFTIEN